MSQDCTEERFLKDVATHKLTVIRDDGVHRHIQFRRPGTRCMSFDLITWPGSLCYTGDMGTYVFSRLEDMFEFFRADPKRTKEGLYINLGYWAEKLDAVDKNSPAKAFCQELFDEAVRSYIADEDTPADFKEAVTEELLDVGFMNVNEAMNAAYHFSHNGRGLSDLWDHNMETYTFHFTWCCYALAWAIKQYDALPAKTVTP